MATSLDIAIYIYTHAHTHLLLVWDAVRAVILKRTDSVSKPPYVETVFQAVLHTVVAVAQYRFIYRRFAV